MRSIATFKEEKLALRFWNYLQGEGVECSLEEDGSDTWAIWVIDEEKIPSAIQSFEKFKVVARKKAYQNRSSLKWDNKLTGEKT